MLNLKQRLKQATILLPSALLVWMAAYAPAAHAVIDISQVPLIVSNIAKPNVIFTYDDSGSMSLAYMADGACDYYNLKAATSPEVNKLYYNPNINYRPGIDYTTTQPYAYPSFTSASRNGYNTSASTTNLQTGYVADWDANNISQYIQKPNGSGGLTSCNNGVRTIADPDSYSAGSRTAYYHVYDGSGSNTSDSNYTINRYAGGGVAWPGAASKTYFDLNLVGTGACTVADDTNSACFSTDQRTNFATWYTFYRTRTLMAKTSASLAFAGIGEGNIFLAYQRLNSCNSLGGSSSSSCPGRYPKLFTGTTTGSDRSDFFQWLGNSPASGGTSLRAALNRAGSYLSQTGIRSPFSQVPGDSNYDPSDTSLPAAQQKEVSCRQNFHVMFTDGRWNGSSAVSGDRDTPGSALTLPDSIIYPSGGQRPFLDTDSTTLADHAFYYWSRDARSLTNNVPQYMPENTGTTSQNYWNYKNDPATWQHLVNYTVGLGVNGDLDATNQDTVLSNIIAGSQNWPDVAANTPQTADDLWHAAVNSRGRYFSAQSPTELVTSFTQVLNNIQEASASTAAVAANGTQISAGSRLYQPVFRSGTWTGNLQSFTTSDGINFSLEWDTGASASTFNSQAFGSRYIITSDPAATATASTTKGVPFRWASINTGQQTNLHTNPVSATNDGNGSARLDYLRGDASNEGASGLQFRTRASTKMGDIVNSGPLFIGATPLRYPDSIESVAHSTFQTFTQGRAPVIYVGANDGILHGFDGSNASTGGEIFGYAPSMLFPKLSKLTDPNYSHTFFVDASPEAGDAFGNFPRCGGTTACWGTVLVGGLGAGGKGIYALDVTDPTKYTLTSSVENNANKVALWEFTDATDIGYTFGKPIITRVRNGSGGTQWVAIFGNGYNSTGDKAILYIVDIITGALIKKINTGISGSNGLSGPVAVDIDGDFITDIVYAGDMLGNLWKFNLRSSTQATWDVAIKNGTTNIPIFKAVDGSSNTQPITSRPLVVKHPDGEQGYLVYFGTGKYMGTSDTSLTTDQTFYAIWDKNNVNTTDAGLPLALTSAPVPSATHANSDANLLRQTVTTVEAVGGVDYRVTSNNGPMVWRTTSSSSPDYLGWYMDVPTGEKIVSNPFLIDERVVFLSIVPKSDPCGFGGDTWIMEPDLRSGARPNSSPFDVNNDGISCGCTADNLPGAGLPPTGRKIGQLVPDVLPSKATQSVSGGCSVLNVGGATGGTPAAGNQTVNSCGTQKQRQSWRQLR